MTHLTPDQIERLALRTGRDDGTPPAGDLAVSIRHLDACERCRDEVDSLRAMARALGELPEIAPSTRFADSVLRRVDLPLPWLEDRLASLPRLAPAAGFAASVLERVDLPVPWLERLVARLPRLAPSPGFATAVMSRVRLPIPWHARLVRFARRRRVALAGAAASTVAASAAGLAWLLGSGVTPLQVGALVLGGARDLAVRALIAAGGIGYELGLVDAGSAITNISPTAALGGLALTSAVGLLSLLAMVRLSRTSPRLRLREIA